MCQSNKNIRRPLSNFEFDMSFHKFIPQAGDLGSGGQGVNQRPHKQKKAVDNAAKTTFVDSESSFKERGREGVAEWKRSSHFRSRMAMGTDRTGRVRVSSCRRRRRRRHRAGRETHSSTSTGMRRNGAKNCRLHDQSLQHELRRLPPLHSSQRPLRKIEISSTFEGKWMSGFCLYKQSPYLLLKGCIQRKSLSEKIESLHSLQWTDDDGKKI